MKIWKGCKFTQTLEDGSKVTITAEKIFPRPEKGFAQKLIEEVDNEELENNKRR